MNKIITKSITFDNEEKIELLKPVEIDTDLSHEDQLLFIVLKQIEELNKKISQTYNFHME